jgi:hypothetical protein
MHHTEHENMILLVHLGFSGAQTLLNVHSDSVVIAHALFSVQVDSWAGG